MFKYKENQKKSQELTRSQSCLAFIKLWLVLREMFRAFKDKKAQIESLVKAQIGRVVKAQIESLKKLKSKCCQNFKCKILSQKLAESLNQSLLKLKSSQSFEHLQLKPPTTFSVLNRTKAWKFPYCDLDESIQRKIMNRQIGRASIKAIHVIWN